MNNLGSEACLLRAVIAIMGGRNRHWFFGIAFAINLNFRIDVVLTSFQVSLKVRSDE